MTDVYLDNCSTTQVCGEAVQAAVNAMTRQYGNPSSLHALGVSAEALVQNARAQIAQTLGCSPSEICFTSGGTEANNMALFGAAAALRRRGNRIVTTRIEHPSAARPADRLEQEGFEVIRLKPGPDGVIPAQELAAAVNDKTILVSLMLVNNETGAIQPVAAAKKALRAAGSPGLVHCDAVQAYGRVRFSPAKIGADLLSVSAHKLHAPKGVGALYLAKGVRLAPHTLGGGQETGLRSGTEPVPAIAAFGEAARVAFERFDEYTQRMAELRDLGFGLLSQLPFIELNSSAQGAPHILNFSVRGVRAETMLHYLAARGIYVSAGSACSRGHRSPVLLAQGLPENRIDSALRVSFSRMNTPEDVRALAAALIDGERGLEHFR